MAIEIIDTLRVFFETQVFGSSALFALFIISVLVILFLFARLDLKLVAILMIPCLLGLAVSGFIPLWVIVVIIIGVAVVWALLIRQQIGSY